LGGGDEHLQTVVDHAHVVDVQSGQFGAAGHHRKPQQQQGTVPQADQPVPGGGEHGAQLVDGQRGGLLHPPPAGGPVTAVGTQRQPGGGGVDRQVHGAVVGLNGADDALDGGRGGGLDLDEVDDVVGQGGPGGRQGPAMVCRAPGGEVLPVVGEGPPGV